MKVLSTDQVMRLHAHLIRRFCGAPGIRDQGGLEAALARPFAEFGGVAAFATQAGKAATLLHGIATGHPFVDGNKRVALAATLVWLQMNGQRLALNQEQRYQLTMRVAEGSLSVEALTRLIEDVLT